MVWSDIGKNLSENLIWVCVMFGLFSLCVLANIIAGIYYHVVRIGQSWNAAQLWTSIQRMLAIGVSTALLAVVATVAPLVLSHFALINESFSKLISVTMIIGMYARGIVKYFKEALETVNNILENRDVVRELQDNPQEILRAEDSRAENSRTEADNEQANHTQANDD